MLSLRPLILQVALRLSGPMGSGCGLEPYRHPRSSLQSSDSPTHITRIVQPAPSDSQGILPTDSKDVR